MAIGDVLDLAHVASFLSVGAFSLLGVLLRALLASIESPGPSYPLVRALAFEGRHFIANCVGCFLMGALVRQPFLKRKLPLLFVGLSTGFCGCLTTFSSWASASGKAMNDSDLNPIDVIATVTLQLVCFLTALDLGGRVSDIPVRAIRADVFATMSVRRRADSFQPRLKVLVNDVQTIMNTVSQSVDAALDVEAASGAPAPYNPERPPPIRESILGEDALAYEPPESRSVSTESHASGAQLLRDSLAAAAASSGRRSDAMRRMGGGGGAAAPPLSSGAAAVTNNEIVLSDSTLSPRPSAISERASMGIVKAPSRQFSKQGSVMMEPSNTTEAQLAMMTEGIRAQLDRLVQEVKPIFEQGEEPEITMSDVQIYLAGFIVVFVCSVLLAIYAPNSWWRDSGRAALLGPPGAWVRYELSQHNKKYFPHFKLFTFIPNVAATVVLVVLSVTVDNSWATAVEVGFCGSLSTVSTFMNEIKQLLGEGRRYGVFYSTTTVLSGMLLAFLIYAVAP